ncbi:MAG: hypothetical protein AB7O43_22415, partial [Hyphomicrobiaceae bacterium]
MSLYEALDRFVGAGVLLSAGLVGSAFPAGVKLDGAELSRFLRERRRGEDYGAVLDCLAKEIWLAQEQRGFPQQMCESHTSALATLLDEVRIDASDFAPALEAAKRALSGEAANGQSITASRQIADSWITRAKAGGRLQQAGLVEDAARFLIELLFQYIVDQPRFLSGLRNELADFKAACCPLDAPASSDATPAPPANASEEQKRSDDAPTPAPVAAPETQPETQAVQSVLVGAVAEIRARHGIPEGALRRFQSILAAQAMPAEQRLARLEELASWLAATLAHLTAQSNDPIELRRLKAEAAKALGDGDLERAMDLLKEVRQNLRDSRRRTEARLAEEMEALKAQMLEESGTTARLAELALARFDFDVAAELFADAAASLPSGFTEIEADYRQRQAEALAARAEISGDTRSLQAAATAFRGAMELVSRTADPAAWARLGVGLGDMLMALGQRKTSSTLEL